jgi:hypothetical protein
MARFCDGASRRARAGSGLQHPLDLGEHSATLLRLTRALLRLRPSEQLDDVFARFLLRPRDGFASRLMHQLRANRLRQDAGGGWMGFQESVELRDHLIAGGVGGSLRRTGGERYDKPNETSA